MHKLLERQVKKLKRKAKEGDFPLDALLDIISSAYEEADEETQDYKGKLKALFNK
mgnify:CR=1 FL=1